MSTGGVSRSGRVRKKSAKLMEMETWDGSEVDGKAKLGLKKIKGKPYDDGDSDSEPPVVKKVAPIKIPKAPIPTGNLPVKKKISLLQSSPSPPKTSLKALSPKSQNIQAAVPRMGMVPSGMSSSSSSSSSSSTTTSSDSSDSEDNHSPVVSEHGKLKKPSPVGNKKVIVMQPPGRAKEKQIPQLPYKPVKVSPKMNLQPKGPPKAVTFEKQMESSGSDGSDAGQSPDDAESDESDDSDSDDDDDDDDDADKPLVVGRSLKIVEESLPKKKMVAKKKPKPKPPQKKPKMIMVGDAHLQPEGKAPAVKKGGARAKAKPEKLKTRPMTAYMLWCQENRKRIVSEHPYMDFSHISKKMGEVWQLLPDKEKMAWKRKAKRLANKNVLISTGKAPGTGDTARIGAAKPSAATSPSSRHPFLATSIRSSDESSRSGVPDVTKPVGTSPIDVAAHLNLLGESLSVIGQRLTEHEGQIAVSGSLSVLLDSTLCALGPLLCLTAQAPQLNGCFSETLSSVLDNVAYIMPGL